MGFEISIGAIGWLVLIVAAVVVGAGMQLIGEERFGYEWIVTGIGTFIGGLAASEFIVSWRTFEPVHDGLALIPAAIGGLIVGVVVAVVTRVATGGSYTGTAATS
jgi:hypothetical protein